MARRPPSLILVAACVAALALRLLMPAGFMPAGDGLMLSICSSSPVGNSVPLSGDTGPACDFALSAAPILFAAALLLALVNLPPLPAPPVCHQTPPARHRRPAPNNRGPPKP